ncbi:MAG TPA: EAL domain-containing protein [Myxococcota bacterium]|nr:EAL domain-containing protein [Myxococcota bacterium]
MSQSIFVGRQPIVDRERRVVAYELLFRASRDAQVAVFEEGGRAAVRVMVNTFASLGMDAVLGRARGFFNVNRDVLLSEAIEALPRDRVVIEVLEDVEADEEVVARCRALRTAGFQIAVDDWVLDDPRQALLPYADVVKIDLPAVPERALRKLTRELRRHEILLLAEKVESVEEFELCHRLGFDRFQGYFFARPVVLEGAEVDATKTTLMKLLQQIASESPTDEIVETFKQDARLGLNLLRLVNTAGRAVRVQLRTIEDAIRHLGLQQLSRWVGILLYAQGDGGELESPLLITAAHRGRLMEGIVATRMGADRAADERERAFLVGMLSLADALLGRPITELVRELRLGIEASEALTHRAGSLGALLSLVESVERGDLSKFEPELPKWDLDLASLQKLDHEAHAWVHGLVRSPMADDAR